MIVVSLSLEPVLMRIRLTNDRNRRFDPEKSSSSSRIQGPPADIYTEDATKLRSNQWKGNRDTENQSNSILQREQINGPTQVSVQVQLLSTSE